jgi:hypothetical protein
MQKAQGEENHQISSAVARDAVQPFKRSTGIVASKGNFTPVSPSSPQILEANAADSLSSGWAAF